MQCIDACGAGDMLGRLKSKLASAGGRIQVIFFKNERELEKLWRLTGQKVWGHAGTYVTAFALESERDSPKGRSRIIARLFHEIRARSTAAKDQFEKEYKRNRPATPEEISAFTKSLRERFEKTNLQMQNEVEERGRIITGSLRREFASLTFAKHPQTMNRDYAMAEPADAATNLRIVVNNILKDDPTIPFSSLIIKVETAISVPSGMTLKDAY
ncbi:MAG: hypothetical protein Q7S07_02575, partial [Candidatus Omnitrophota bacterium]|nr:hypothetical protein [Candidatus Omnitrophota bacterium]